MLIGRYEVQGELGRGGMGTVLLGYDPLLRRKVAIKSVRTDGEADGAARLALETRLHREAEAAAKLRHPGIVAVYDVIQTEAGAHIVMECVEGRTLTDFMTQGKPTDPAFVLRVLTETAAALDHAHARQIIHRDIKPGNIMVDEAGSVRVTDFGIAKIVGAQTLTDPGMAAGTLDYMSPEQLESAPVNGRADQFSLAVLAYRLLTGQRMYEAQTLRSLSYKIATAPPPAASRANPALPAAADAVLGKALAKSAGERFGTCSEFVAALGRALGLGGTSSGPYVLRQDAPAPTEPMLPRSEPRAATVAPEAFAEPVAGTSPRGKRIAILVGTAAAAVALGLTILAIARHFTTRVDPVSDSQPPPAVNPSGGAALSQAEPQSGPPASPSAGQSWQNPKDGEAYVWIAAGSFTTGCVSGDTSCDADEKPPREVSLQQGFWMGRTEASVAAYERFAEATHGSMPPAPAFNAAWGMKDHPMVQITWAEAKGFCEWAGGRLPSEEQWEYAARGGKAGQRFVTGDRIGASDANFAGASSHEGTMPVESFAPNGFGLFQMSGNAAEWTDGSEGGQRVVRGGSWNVYVDSLRLSRRVAVDPERRNFAFGVRCVQGS